MSCCPPRICEITEDHVVCNMIQLLPDGPLWDRPKVEALQSRAPIGSHMVDYSVYAGKVLYQMLHGILWPSLREADPRTATVTIPDWLTRLGWEGCYKSECQNYRCGETDEMAFWRDPLVAFCQDGLAPSSLTQAVNRGIVLALIRQRTRPMKTLANLNWILEPLGARLSPIVECLEGCEPKPRFTVCPVEDEQIDSAPDGSCSQSKFFGRENAFYSVSCGGHADTKFFPGVAAAVCIIRSLLKARTCCDGPAAVYSATC